MGGEREIIMSDYNTNVKSKYPEQILLVRINRRPLRIASFCKKIPLLKRSLPTFRTASPTILLQLLLPNFYPGHGNKKSAGSPSNGVRAEFQCRYFLAPAK